MQEGAIMEIVKNFLFLIGIMVFLTLTIFFFQLGDTNTFKQRVNYEIERQGGLTEEAVDNLSAYSEESFGGRYTIESEQLNQKVGYGEIVDYTIISKFDVIIFDLPPVEIPIKGTGVSQVR